MVNQIIKRDGRTVPFDQDKIANAIFSAAQAVGGTDKAIANSIANDVNQILNQTFPNSNPTVEQVQDIVEQTLIKSGYDKTAKAYILYRNDRTRVREMNTKLMKTYEDLTFKSATEIDIKRENGNIDGETAMGTMLKYGSEGSKQFYEMFVLDPVHSKAHQDGDIHIHDLDFYALTETCCQIDILSLFKDGFSTGHGHVREPNSIRSYASLTCIALQASQNDQHQNDLSWSFFLKKL